MAKITAWVVSAVSILLTPAFGQTITGGNCSLISLTGNYAVTLTGRQVSATGAFQAVQQSNGTINFDGQGHATFTLATNTNGGSTQQSYSGAYTLPSNCEGTLVANVATGVVVNYTLVTYNTSKSFLISGTDGVNVISGGGSIQPPSCITSTLSGVYSVSANGYTISGNAIGGVDDITGELQFDGTGKVTASLAVTGGTTSITGTATGTYSLVNACLYSAKLTDTTGKISNLNLSVTNVTGADFDINAANSSLIFSGAGHSSFTNPGQAVTNGASFLPGLSPPGTIFSIFGQNLATDTAQAASLPLPDTLLTTSVNVNGVPAPLFFVSPNQINAQLPVATALGLATIVVNNNGANSNAAAFIVPDSGPGIFTFSQNGQTRAIVQDASNNNTLNSQNTPSKAGDTLVAYFTGGGSVQTKGALQTGIAAPGVLAPVTDSNSVTVAGKAATVTYVGLTPGFVGLYQANFVVPTGIAAGDRVLVITVGTQASNGPLISISN